MEIEFATHALDQLETDKRFDMGLPTAIVTAYRRRLGDLRSAQDERDLYAMRSWRFEKLRGRGETNTRFG